MVTDRAQSELVRELTGVIKSGLDLATLAGCEHLLSLSVVRQAAAKTGLEVPAAAQAVLIEVVKDAYQDAGTGHQDSDLIALRALCGVDTASSVVTSPKARVATRLRISERTVGRNIGLKYAPRLARELGLRAVEQQASPELKPEVFGSASFDFHPAVEATRAIESQRGLFLGLGQLQVLASIEDQINSLLSTSHQFELRALLTAPTKISAEMAALRTGRSPEETHKALEDARTRWCELAERVPSPRLEVRFLQMIPPYAGLVRSGEGEERRGWIRPASWGTHAAGRPLFELDDYNTPGILDFYVEDFSRMWESARPS